MIGTTRATAASGAIAVTIDPGKAWKLEEIRVHLSDAGGTGNLTATLDANAGATYDAVIVTQDMTSVSDLVYQPTRPYVFESGDKLVIAYANANNRTYGVEVKHS